jgi:ParB/RepB/Spo0J family partition protein
VEFDFSELTKVSSLLSEQNSNANGVRTVSVESIKPDPNQPRMAFDEESLAELAQSIRSIGIIQPPVVRTRDDGYILISGERRWRAARQIGLDMIDVIVRDDLSARAQLVENIQREALSAWELYRVISAEVAAGVTHAELARALGKSRTWVTAYAAVDNMPEPIVCALQQGRVTDITALAHLRRLHDVMPAAAAELLNAPAPISRSTIERVRDEAHLSCPPPKERPSQMSTGGNGSSEPQPEAMAVTTCQSSDRDLSTKRSSSSETSGRPSIRILVFYEGASWVVDYRCQKEIDGEASVRLESKESGCRFAPLEALKLQSIEWL